MTTVPTEIALNDGRTNRPTDRPTDLPELHEDIEQAVAPTDQHFQKNIDQPLKFRWVISIDGQRTDRPHDRPSAAA